MRQDRGAGSGKNGGVPADLRHADGAQQEEKGDRQDEGEDTVGRHGARRRHRFPRIPACLYTVCNCRDFFQCTYIRGIVIRKRRKRRGTGFPRTNEGLPVGSLGPGGVGGRFPVAGPARRRGVLGLVAEGAPGHGGESRRALRPVAGGAGHPRVGVRPMGENDVPVRVRQAPRGSAGETVSPRLRGIGGLAMAGGAIRGRCRPGVGRVRTVAGNADAFRDGHVPVVAECPVPPRARNHEKYHQDDRERHANADSRHPSDGTGESGARQDRLAPTVAPTLPPLS